MPTLSTKANRLYPSLPNIDDSLESHTAALQAVKDSIQTHERQDGNYLKSFIRFEELIDLGIIDSDGDFILNIDVETGDSSIALGNLSDVTLTSPSDNSILSYDTASGEWIDQTAAQLGLSTTDHEHPPQDISGDIDLGDLGDVDITGANNYDLLFRDDDGDWKPTQQLLQWDGADLHMPLGDLRFYAVGDSVESAIRQNFPASGDLTVQVPGGNLYLKPGVDVYVDDSSNLIINSEQWIKWLNTDDNQISLLQFAPAAGGSGTAIGHVIKRIMTGVSTTNGTYTDVTGAVITFAELEANEDYVVFVRAFVGAAGGNTPLNGVQLTKDGTLVGGSEMLYEPPWGLQVNLHGMMYYWGGVVNAGSQGDLQLQIKSGNAGVDTCFADKVTLMAIKVADLGSNVTTDVDTNLVEIDDGSFPSAYSNMHDGVTIGDGVSDYLVFGSMQIEDYTGGSNNVDSQVSDGTNIQIGSGIGMGDFSDTNVFGFCHLWQAPDAGTTLQIQARTSGWPVDKKYACLVAIRLNGFLDYHGEYLDRSGALTGQPPRAIQTLAFTAAATADYCIMGCGTGGTGAASDSPDALLRNDLNGGGDATLAGIFDENFTKAGTYHGPDPHWLVSDDQSWTAGDTIDADYVVDTGSSGSAEWWDHFLISFAWSTPAADEFFKVGNVGYTTRLLGLTNQLNNDRAITWLNSAGTAVELAILGAAVTGDDDLASVVLLATAETSSGDGDGEFISDIGSHTLTATEASGGVAQVSSTQAKFGTVSMFCDDAAGAVSARWGTTVNSTDFDMAAGDFTFECFLNFERLSATDIPIFSKWIWLERSFLWTFNSTAETFVFTYSTDGTGTGGGASIAWPTDTYAVDTWYHMALVRDGNTVTCYVDGVACATTVDVTGITLFTGDHEFEVLSMESNGAGDHATYIDDIRITKGVARYTTAFTPPTATFPQTGNVVAPFILGDPSVDMYLDANEIRIRGATTANYLAIDHDDTDINIDGVNTTDINITNITSIQAGTVDVDFDDITATTYGGILEENLTDKSVQEEIQTYWTWKSTQPKIRFEQTDAAANNQLWEMGVDNEQFVLTLWNDAETQLVDIVQIDRTLNVLDDFAVLGPFSAEGVTIWDDARTDNMAITHDGAFLNVNYTQTSRHKWLDGIDHRWYESGGVGWYGRTIGTTDVMFEKHVDILRYWFEDGDGTLYYTQNFNGSNTDGFVIHRGNTLELRGTTGANKVTIRHDNADLAIVGTNTTDIDITGFDSIQAGTVDADFDGLSATYLQFDTSVASPTPAEGRLTWNADEGTLEFGLPGGNVNLQIGQEHVIRARNTTGVQIDNGAVVYITGASGNRPLIDLADASDEVTSRVIAVATEDIAHNANGYVTTAGLVREVNTDGMAAGSDLWLSEVAGEFTTTKPVADAHHVFVGHVVVEGVGNGQILVAITPDSLVGFSDLTLDLLATIGTTIGQTLDQTSVSVASNGTTITFSLEQSGGGDVRFMFSDGAHTHDCDPTPASIALTPGTDTSPQINYVYILQSTKALTVSTSSFPAAEHARLATILCQTAASAQTDGVYKMHAWTDHNWDLETGHIAHNNFWIRSQPATWRSGTLCTPTVGAATFDLSVATGSILQLHPHSYPAFDTSTGSEVMIVNQNGTPYDRVGNMVSQITDASGGSMSGKYYNLVIWGVVSEADGDCQLMVNLPTGSYVSSSAAILDSSATTVYDIPTDFIGTGFLIARLVCRHQVSGNTYSIVSNIDLRGKIPSTSAGGTVGGGVTAIGDLSDVDPTGANEDDVLTLTSGVWTPAALNTANWDTAYGWGDHSGLYELIDATLVRDDDAGYNKTEWDTAYGWGDHSGTLYEPYDTAIVKSDENETISVDWLFGSGVSAQGAVSDFGQVGSFVFMDYNGAQGRFGAYDFDTAAWVPALLKGSTVEIAGIITLTGAVTATSSIGATGAVTGSNLNVANWDTAYGWGDHGSGGYLTAVLASDVNAESSTDGYVLTSDGAGNAAWEVLPGGGGPFLELTGGTISGTILIDTLNSHLRFRGTGNADPLDQTYFDRNAGNVLRLMNYDDSTTTFYDLMVIDESYGVAWDDITNFSLPNAVYINMKNTSAVNKGVLTLWNDNILYVGASDIPMIIRGNGISITNDVLMSKAAPQITLNNTSGAVNGMLTLTCVDTSQVWMHFGGVSNPDGGRIGYSDNADQFLFYTDDAERATLDATSLKVSQGTELYCYGYGDDGRVITGVKGSGVSGSIFAPQHTDAAALNYRACFAYDCYWDDTADNWVADRTTLGRKWMIDMGYHNDAFRVRRFDGTVSSPWADSAWADFFKIDGSGSAIFGGTGSETLTISHSDASSNINTSGTHLNINLASGAGAVRLQGGTDFEVTGYATLSGLVTIDHPPTSGLDPSLLLTHTDFPILAFQESAAAAGDQLWDLMVYQEAFHGRLNNDAGTVTVDWLTVQRTDNVCDSITLTATDLISTGNVLVGDSTTRIKLDSADGTLYWGATGTAGRLSWDTNKAQVFAQTSNALWFGANNAADDMYIDTSGHVHVVNDLEAAGNQLRLFDGRTVWTHATLECASGDGWCRIAHHPSNAGRGGCTITITGTGGSVVPNPTRIFVPASWSASAASLHIQSGHESTQITKIRSGYDATNFKYIDIQVSHAADSTYVIACEAYSTTSTFHWIAEASTTAYTPTSSHEFNPSGIMLGIYKADGGQALSIDAINNKITTAFGIYTSGSDVKPAALTSGLTSNQLYLDGKDAIDGNDTYLRFNGDGDFSNGIHINGRFEQAAGADFYVKGTFRATGLSYFTSVVDLADNTLVRPTIKDYGIKKHTETSSSGTLTIDMALGNSVTHVLTENITTVSIINPPASGVYGEVLLKIHQHASSPKTVTYGSAFKFPGGTHHVMSTGVNDVDMVHFSTVNAGVEWQTTFAQDFS